MPAAPFRGKEVVVLLALGHTDWIVKFAYDI